VQGNKRGRADNLDLSPLLSGLLAPVLPRNVALPSSRQDVWSVN
jgi:hypothetical protein